MDELKAALDRGAPLQGLLGYLNLSEGRPDPRFEKQTSDVFRVLDEMGVEDPWMVLPEVLQSGLQFLREKEPKIFSDTSQANAVLSLTYSKVLPAYKEHHSELFFHQPDEYLFQPYFVARAFEAVLNQRGPWDEEQRIVKGSLRQLNDYVGHRPIAVLESRPRGEPYDHERFRPIPLFIKEAGAAHGRYKTLIERTLEILGRINPDILRDACFDLELMDELAVDPRGYDFDHPADKRPNYAFGEWDPHLIDNSGFYRRYVVRQIVLDGLIKRIEEAKDVDPDEVLTETAAVFGGTILMAAGISGAGPETHDSTVSLANLVPRIARYREAYYANLQETLAAEHQARLKEEAAVTRQPFGATRHALNQYLSQLRALQLQQRHLALLFAEIGYGDCARRQIGPIPVASARLMTELHIHLKSGTLHIERGEIDEAAELLPTVEDLLRRGIACGAFVDPWNILGFGGQYRRFNAMEDSIHDHRIDDLVEVVDGIFTLYGRLLSEGVAAGTLADRAALTERMRQLADWWDRFATVEVSDVPRVHGGENVSSAESVANALEQWRSRGEATADLAFWRDHLDNFRSPKAFALVVDALLRKEDYRASMALMMTWLEQAEQAPLEDGEHSFHTLVLRWMLAVCAESSDPETDSISPADRLAMVTRFFDYLEANAQEYWQVPRLDVAGTGEDADPDAKDEEEQSLYGAAYEGVTYKDSTDDDVDGEVLDIMPQKDFDLAEEAERVEKRLRFMATLARLWNVASRLIRARPASIKIEEDSPFHSWLARAQQNSQGLLSLLDTIHDHAIPRPAGNYESLIEFDRRRVVKERLVGVVLATCLDTALAVGALRGALKELSAHAQSPPWEPITMRLEQALWSSDADAARELVPEFIEAFRDEPLLYRPLVHGGHPRQILRSSIAQVILRGLVANLPRLGLVRETYLLIRAAHEMERQQPLDGPRVTEFDHLFQIGCQAVVDSVLDTAAREQDEKATDPNADQRVVDVLETLVEPFLSLWIEHSQTLRVAMLEGVGSDKEWRNLSTFIRRYGGDLFDARFMTLGNLRGILHRGVGGYFDYLRTNADPLKPIRLIEELDDKIPRGRAEKLLQIILQTIIENYEEYRDYNATTTQSDYGENLYQLFDFLRIKASYERNAWQFRPLGLAHQVLAKRSAGVAALWREQFRELSSQVAEEHVDQLTKLEEEHGMHLATIADRVKERFAGPFAIDRLCALVEPAMEQAKDGGTGKELEEAVKPFASVPTGVGLDLPVWLRRMQEEVGRVENAQTALASLAETLYQIPKIAVSLNDLQQQMEGWDDGQEDEEDEFLDIDEDEEA